MAALLRLFNILQGGRFPFHKVHHFFMFFPKGVLSPRTECSSAYSSKIRVNSGLGWERARRALLHGTLESTLTGKLTSLCVCVRVRRTEGFHMFWILRSTNLFTNSGFPKQISSPKVPAAKQLKTTGKVQDLQGAKTHRPRVSTSCEPSHPTSGSRSWLESNSPKMTFAVFSYLEEGRDQFCHCSY